MFVRISEYGPDTVETVSHKEMNSNQDVPSMRVATQVYVIAKEVVKGHPVRKK